ncbi:MAG: calcium-translocating P-type ATPase, PMCA-type [Sphaerochaetaceae bacterium]|nr:calcium-translocating P-type ATPase, PMCA-type [Sphaerochaetaceae bacterium]
MDYHLKSCDETFQSLQSSKDGLSSSEAAKRLEQYGPNKLNEAKKKSLVKRFFEQLADPMIIILLAAALISAITSVYNHEFPSDVIIILSVVIINAVLGVFQESKAEKAIEALQKMSAQHAKVIRDGKVVNIKSEELVIGDVVLLDAGDAVPCDMRLFECASLKIEEAALTGESVPVTKYMNLLSLKKDEKTIPLGDRKNMAYMGSSVSYGRGKGVVCFTGMDTEMGKIASSLESAEDGETPLQKKLSSLSKVLTVIVLAVCAFIFVFGMLRQYFSGNPVNGQFFLHTFMLAVSLAVAAIPEGLVAVVTIVLSMGVTNMSKKNAIIRKLSAVETLGCASVICSDKTGTLTQNKMTVTEMFGADKNTLVQGMALCTDAEINEEGSVGDPTEVALVNAALDKGFNKNDLLSVHPRVAEAPFDSIRKMMTTVHKYDSEFISYTKGAPDVLLSRCSQILTENGIRAITEDDKIQIREANKAMADKALRVLALGMRKFNTMPEDTSEQGLEKDLIFIGLSGMIDPVRPEVKDAIKICKEAGIRPIMITGDHIDTAIAIAAELGIIKDKDEAITGAMLSELSDEEFDKVVEKYSVYARVQPEHKTRIVSAWIKKNHVTAMTGDGVNDAPSIKTADIGIGMGITGTDVTKNVADMVLSDDNFATIVTAVDEGRRIYANIRKAIQFLLSSNLAEVIAIFIANLFALTILEPAHLLWINLITDCFPALALGGEKRERNIMKRPPRSSSDGIFADGMGIDTFYQGALIALLTLLAYFVGHRIESGLWEIKQSHDGITMAFLTLSMCEIFHSMNMRSRRDSIFTLLKDKNHNKLLLIAALASLVLTTAVIYVPFLSKAFGFTHISATEYFVALALAFAIIPLVEIIKFIQRKTSK